MRRYRTSILLILGFALGWFWLSAVPVRAATERTTAQIVAGRFVSSQEDPQTLWYVHPGLPTRQLVSDWASIESMAARSGATVDAKAFDQIPNDLTGRTFDSKLTRKLQGRLLLDTSNGTVWYVSVKDQKRYQLRSAADARARLQADRLGISQKNLEKIPLAGESGEGDRKLRQRLRGRVLWNVTDGSYWYVSPKNLQRYPLVTEEDATAIFSSQRVGISAGKIATIPLATDALHPKTKTTRTYSGKFLRPAFDPTQLWYVSPRTKQRVPITPGNFQALTIAEQTIITAKGLASIRMVGEAEYLETTVVTPRGSFRLKLLSSDLSLPGLKILTLGGDTDTCADLCLTFSVGQYATSHNGVAAVNGGYFCPGETAACGDRADSYYGPLFHSDSRVMINQELVGTSPYPMLIFDNANKPYFFSQAAEVVSPEHFTATTGATMQAGIANWPALIINGVNVIETQLLDNGQRNTKATRVALGVKGMTVSFIVIADATVPDTAAVVETLGLDYAINLDGGSSTALWQYEKYLQGPGRTVPNAIVIARAT